MFIINCYKVPPESFELFRYYYNKTADLNDRFNDLMRDLDDADNLDEYYSDRLYIYTCGDCIDIRDIISKRGYKFLRFKGTSKCNSLKVFLGSKEFAPLTFISFVVVQDESDELNGINENDIRQSNVRLLKVSNSPSTAKTGKKHQTKRKILLTSIDDINIDIGNELERIILQSLKLKVDILYQLWSRKKNLDYEASASSKSRRENKAKSSFENEFLTSKKRKMQKNDHVSFGSGIDKSRSKKKENITRDGIEGAYANEKGGTTVESQIILENLNCIDRDTIEGLLMEMLAVFKQSNIPDGERPQIDINCSKVNTDQIMKELLTKCPTVEGVGYHYSCFVVYMKKQEKNMKNMEHIKGVLERYEIMDYKIEFVSETKLYSKYDVNVGSTIELCGIIEKKSATLGCFAESKSDEYKQKYILTCKHVAVHGRTFRICNNCNKHNEIFAEILDSSNTPSGLDIAVLKLIPNSSINICTGFKAESVDDEAAKGWCHDEDDDDESLRGKLYHYREDSTSDIVCCGQKVHIWGAISKPGKGVVTTTTYKDGDMKALILIEDRVPKKENIPERFCCPGDSGAIVCVEDRSGQFVHVVAMIIGMINYDDVRSNPKIRGKYLTTPLSSGLEELEERTNISFRICDSFDS